MYNVEYANDNIEPFVDKLERVPKSKVFAMLLKIQSLGQLAVDGYKIKKLKMPSDITSTVSEPKKS
jgi:hypothetical protein